MAQGIFGTAGRFQTCTWTHLKKALCHTCLVGESYDKYCFSRSRTDLRLNDPPALAGPLAGGWWHCWQALLIGLDFWVKFKLWAGICVGIMLNIRWVHVQQWVYLAHIALSELMTSIYVQQSLSLSLCPDLPIPKSPCIKSYLFGGCDK